MTEYEELREEIARKLSQQYGFGKDWWDNAVLWAADMKPMFLTRADKILSIVAKRCWFKDEGIAGRGTSVEKRMYHQLKDKGWQPVKEIKKE